MPGDLRKVSLLAIVLLVLLRVSIGWHLLYEGLWKLSTQHTSTPWTSDGYLKNSTGPLRPTFRQMTGDPNDLKWLDYAGMSKKFKDWQTRFVSHYNLDELQAEAFKQLMDGQETFEVALKELPPGLDLEKISGINREAISFEPDEGVLVVNGKLHLLPTERDRLIATATKISEADKSAKRSCDQFISAVNRAYKVSSKLSFNEQLTAVMEQDTDRVGVVLQGEESSEKPLVVKVGDVEYYHQLTKRFDANYAKASTQFEWDHIDKMWKEVQDLRRKLVGPVQSLEKEMHTEAERLLTPEQLSKGPVPEPLSPVGQINWRTMWGLTVFGLLLILGLFTRASALGGAALLALFYLAMPPWPGVQEIPSIEHNLIVNKVFVEMLALLAIAALPSGKWFGLDAVISALFRQRKQADSARQAGVRP
ncbi:MAG: hypothetical protein WCJ09_10500 [Planctomycetota bacterium]